MRSLGGVYLFFEEKVLPSGCSPRASCYLEQVAGGSYLEIALILRRKAPEHIPGFFIKNNLDMARSGFFLSWGLEVVYLEEVFLVTCAFLKKKVHSLSVAPEPLAIWNKKVGGSWIIIIGKTKNLFWGYVGSCRHSQGCIQVTREL